MAEQQQPMIGEIPCARCKKPYEVIVPKVQVIEHHSMSMMVWVHEKTQDCPHCGMAHQMQIGRLDNFTTVWVAVQKKESSLIVPATQIPKIM